jgi:hypothetical protein
VSDEFVLFPEMVAAGMEELAECNQKGIDDGEKVACVFLAMYGVYQMNCVRGESERVH